MKVSPLMVTAKDDELLASINPHPTANHRTVETNGAGCGTCPAVRVRVLTPLSAATAFQGGPELEAEGLSRHLNECSFPGSGAGLFAVGARGRRRRFRR